MGSRADGRVKEGRCEQIEKDVSRLRMSQNCQHVSMLEIAKNLLLCQNQHGENDNSDLDCLTPREERTEKLKFKLIGLQLVNQIFCRKLRKQREESERLSNNNYGGGKDCASVSSDQNKPSSPRLSFSEVYDGECLKSLVAIRFEENGHQVASSQNEDDSDKSNEDKFGKRERVQMRSVSLKNYRRRFSTKNLKSGDRRHHSLKVDRKVDDQLKQASCPDLASNLHLESVSSPPTQRRLEAYDSVDDFTSQLFAEHILPTNSQEDLLSICFE